MLSKNAYLALRSFRIVSRIDFGLVPNYSTHPSKFVELQERYRKSDKVSSDWELIYKAPMDLHLNYASTYVTLSSGAIFYLAYHFCTNPVNINEPLYFGASDLLIANNMYEFSLYIGAFLFFHVTIRRLISKFVVRMYKSESKYLAVYRGWWFNSLVKNEFHGSDVKHLKPPVIVPWSDTRFKLGHKSSIILHNYFKTPRHYNELTNQKSVHQ